MIRTLLSTRLLDRMFPGRAVVAKSSLGILLGRRGAFGFWDACFGHGTLRPGGGLIALRNRGWATLVFLRHEFSFAMVSTLHGLPLALGLFAVLVQMDVA